jgi:hypothetical protein
MKPPLPRIETAVPRLPHVQIEIAKAIRTLMGPDEDEPARARRAEIAAIRHDLETLAGDIPKAFAEAGALALAELRRMKLAKKYNPDQPRVPAGNRDGGQWTGGSEDGSETSLDQKDGGAGDARNSRVRYAQASTSTAIDDANGDNGHVTTFDNTQNDLRNLYDVLLTAVHSRLGDVLHHFGSHYLDIRTIHADQVPDNNPRQPIPFVDSDDKQIFDAEGNPLLRPLGLPPELYAQAGLAVRSWAQPYVGLEQGRGLEDPDVANARSMASAEIASKILLPLAPGGPLDAERFDWTYVLDYRHYQNIMIGVYGAAAGMTEGQILSLVDLYATIISGFRANEKKDEIYTHSAKQDVQDTKSGYELYQSGRIRLEP